MIYCQTQLVFGSEVRIREKAVIGRARCIRCHRLRPPDEDCEVSLGTRFRIRIFPTARLFISLAFFRSFSDPYFFAHFVK